MGILPMQRGKTLAVVETATRTQGLPLDDQQIFPPRTTYVDPAECMGRMPMPLTLRTACINR